LSDNFVGADAMTSCLSLGRVAVVVFLFGGSFLFNSIADWPEGVCFGPTDARAALDVWTAARAYPQTDVSPSAYLHSFEMMQANRTSGSPADRLPTPWVSLGPTNFAGRTIAIAINPLNPSTLYIGAAAGGLWRTRTGGLGGDWQRIVTGFPALGINSIAINPIDTNTIYAGTGEVYRYNGSTGGIVIRASRGSYGMGILKTTDGGSSWTKSLDWSYDQRRGVQAMRFNPQNTNTVFAATSEGVYRTTDAGASWTNVLNVVLAQDLAINPLDTTLVLATCGNFASSGAGVYRSTDGGASFGRIASLPAFTARGMLEIYGANPWSVYSSLADTSIGSSTTGTGSLWKSTDFGANWTMLSNQSVYGVQGWYSQFVAVHPTDSMIVLRGAQDLWRSTNGGITSVDIPYGTVCWADYHNYAHHPTNPNILYIVDDGGVWRTTDFGSTYTGANTGLITSQFYNGFSASAQDSNRALGQVQDHFGYMYTGSVNWPSSAVDEIGWTSINQSNDNIMYAGNRGGGSISKSVNRGLTFSTSSSGIPSSGTAAWNTPFVQSVSNPNVLYFGRAIVYKTTNGGTNWSATNGGAALDGNPALSMGIARTSQDTVFVGTVPGTGRVHIFRTTNGGTNWTDVTSTLPNRYPLDIAVDPRDSRIVYIAFGGFDTTRLAKSTDAGMTWQDISGTLPNVPTTAVAIDPFNTDFVYAGCDLGVFVSTNGGNSWSEFNTGLFEAVVVGDLVVSPSSRTLLLASHSNGVFRRKLLSTSPTDVRTVSPTTPADFSLDQNYPNPFNPTTYISYYLAFRSRVRITVADVAGRTVATLAEGNQDSGRHMVAFDGSAITSGVYFYRLEVNDRVVAVRKALLIK
jgi:photosystem II stability/assembly factor-like uncharacterized protein